MNPVIAIVGPTASGKSTLGIEVALQLNGEIINCDSVQVYKEIQIATAKVPLAERKGVPHHLIDFVSPDINYTAGEWAREAANKIEEIEARGRAFGLETWRLDDAAPDFLARAEEVVRQVRATRRPGSVCAGVSCSA